MSTEGAGMVSEIEAAGAAADRVPILEAAHVSHVYGVGATAVTAVRDVSLTVWPGTFTAITGRSGSGKTTLLNLFGGLDTPSSGSIRLAGKQIDHLGERERTVLRRHTIGIVFQSFALLPTFSALENVELALHIAGVGERERLRRARETLELVGLGDRLDHRPFELSGGEQERVAIARALANRPPLILADEPTGELDTTTGQEIILLLREMVAVAGATFIVATHDPAVCAATDAAYDLLDGQLRIREPD
jgi:putative ABC transport system ATP-binding protein